MPDMSRAISTAPTGLLPLPRPLMTGEVLDAAWRLFRASLLRTLPYSGLAVLVLEMPKLYSALFGEGTIYTIASFRRYSLANLVSQAFGVSDSTLVFVGALLLSVLMF